MFSRTGAAIPPIASQSWIQMSVKPLFLPFRSPIASCLLQGLVAACALTACQDSGLPHETNVSPSADGNGTGGDSTGGTGSGQTAGSGATGSGGSGTASTETTGSGTTGFGTTGSGTTGSGTTGSDVEGPDAGPAADAAVSPGASVANYDWAPGDYPPDLHGPAYLELKDVPGQDGKTRHYKVHVPKSYSASVPAPVLFALHGYQQNAVMFVVDGTGFVEKSEEEGFILVLPNGVQEDGIGGSWNAGICCGAASGQELDDVGFIRAIFAEVQKHVNVDASRVYATGLSNGGFMTHRLACEAADLFAAVAPVASSIGTPELGSIGTNPSPDFENCSPSRPISVLAMHGDADWIVPYAGMKRTLDYWAERAGCALETVAAQQPESGGDTHCVTYTDCPQDIEITGCSVAGGGHCWFGDEGCGTGAPGLGNLIVGNDSDFLNATDATWDFLKRFRR